MLSENQKIKQYHSLEEVVTHLFGDQVRCTERERVYGGDINDAWRVSLSSGEKIFVKTNHIRNLNFFQTEMQGLLVLRSTGEIGVPKPLGIGTDQKKQTAFLMMEYIGASKRVRDYWECFGRQLAYMHKADASGYVERSGKNGAYGFFADNYIGANPQKNTPKETWVDFYRDCRLRPQMKMAEHYMDAGMKRQCSHLLDHLDTYLREPMKASILHGDLWSGNAVCGTDGKAWILDPAVYVGDHETDLAMTQLFGKFPDAFYAAYHEVYPIDKEFYERRDLYHLYHLLNHLNLFGSSYLGSVCRILKKYSG